MKIKKILTLTFIVFIFMSNFAKSARIKDIVDIIGLQDNLLSGLGLVVGLKGTGDKSEASIKAAVNLLKRYKFKVSSNQLILGNIAIVMVTATLPPLAKKGSKIDVTVSSIGNARSLSGGVLLATYLKALNEDTYAVAQGPLSHEISDISNNVILTNGAIVEKEVPVKLTRKDNLFLRLKSPDINTANEIAKAINKKFSVDCSYAIDFSAVKIKVPFEYQKEHKLANFIGDIFSLEVSPDIPARVVINERTGTVIIGGSVSISPVTIAHGFITVKITGDEDKGDVTIQKLTDVLFNLGVTPKDLVEILRALKRMGALHAELVTM